MRERILAKADERRPQERHLLPLHQLKTLATLYLRSHYWIVLNFEKEAKLICGLLGIK